MLEHSQVLKRYHTLFPGLSSALPKPTVGVVGGKRTATQRAHGVISWGPRQRPRKEAGRCRAASC